MKKITLIVFILTTLAGCTFTAADKVGPDEYMLTCGGSVFNLREGMLESINNKAKKVCNGKPYRREGDAGGPQIVNMRTQIGSTPTTVLSMKAICEDDG
ncbi:hypothetical protein [Pseudomonas sp. RGM2987]|uniref:hypothetical protein n=1 Tax=Pseudomonas sp. RGM2987 TaxID=2930090 RepID=UPI001FD6D9E5|nr:hypothetical protein [Pseudomonas sp. RGM2987]MCJ8207430.1 hypothetical protein [Pseudomonas sp. RGM2987]